MLLAADDPVSVERPADFDDGAARNRALALGARLADAFDVTRSDIGPPAVQDASFDARFVLRADPEPSSRSIWVMISNFGRLAVAGIDNPGVHTETELRSLVDPDTWARLTGLITESGYVLIAEEPLWALDTGRNPALRQSDPERPGQPTWWTRFFDWL